MRPFDVFRNVRAGRPYEPDEELVPECENFTVHDLLAGRWPPLQRNPLAFWLDERACKAFSQSRYLDASFWQEAAAVALVNEGETEIAILYFEHAAYDAGLANDLPRAHRMLDRAVALVDTDEWNATAKYNFHVQLLVDRAVIERPVGLYPEATMFLTENHDPRRVEAATKYIRSALHLATHPSQEVDDPAWVAEHVDCLAKLVVEIFSPPAIPRHFPSAVVRRLVEGGKPRLRQALGRVASSNFTNTQDMLEDLCRLLTRA